MKRIYTAATIAVLGISLTGFAQEGGASDHRHARPGGGALWESADANGDGAVSYEEATQALPGMTEERFAHLDRDGDGLISKDESPMRARSHARTGEPHGTSPGNAVFQRFQEADADGDGALDLEELRAIAPRMTEDRFAHLDEDGSETLTPQELRNSSYRPAGEGHRGNPREQLQQADADGNGELSIDELRTVRPHMSPERFAALDSDGSGGVTRDELIRSFRGEHRPPNAQSRSDFVAQLFERADSDSDGELTITEVQQARPRFDQSSFDQMDSDGSGTLSMEEYSNRFSRTHGSRGGADGHRHPLPEATDRP